MKPNIWLQFLCVIFFGVKISFGQLNSHHSILISAQKYFGPMQKIETHNGLLYINPIRLNSNQLRLGWNLNFDQNDYLNVNAIASLQEYGLNIDFRNFTFVPNNPNYNELTKGSKFCGGLEINLTGGIGGI